MNIHFLNFEDKLYIVKRTIYESHKPNVSLWKNHLRADKVLRKDGILYFLIEITEVDYEDIIEKTIETEEHLINKTQIITEIIKEDEQVDSIE